ncbi:adenylate/guanylate cyclase domain-containing protein [Flagellimonas oceanensis]|uniref:adenylate/guanylate cyclase domain-containing protein n=1 Tax=Flagellimonas oceanensis TaxID=2499163 RepID=UPI000F8CA33C|nr:adenylate/guanylate cyclase domain-containing protein [Allomuricauda oceanensis]
MIDDMVRTYHHITIINDASFLIGSDDSILKAGLNKGVPFCCECGGRARCSTCRILVVEGEENLSETNTAEKNMQKYFELPRNVRLACQTYVKGGAVRIKRIMNDESDYPLYLRNKIIKDENIGKEMRLCLLFLDIRNFTPFVEHNLAFDVIHVVRKMFYHFEEIIREHGGKIVETAGDGLYAAFGFEDTTKESANKTVSCVKEMFKELKRLNELYFKKYFKQEIEIGVGAHLGKVAAGDLLLQGNPHQLVMGYPVNVAARIQDLTKKLNNSFIVSKDVYELLEERPRAANSLENLKGVEEPFLLYLLGEQFNYQKGLPSR